MPMVAVYLWLNSNWATQVPYLFSYGREGSGKSAIATVMEKMLDITCLQAASTAVSIRNEVNNSRFPEGEDGPENDCFFLVWDNVNLQTLEDPKIWEILLSGAIRGKDRVAVSSTIVGENKYFYTFCPKVYSSVWALHANPNYRELTRRTMVLFHEKLSEEKISELTLVPSDEIDFSDFFDVKMQQFFNQESRYLEYEEFKKAWNKARFPKWWDVARKRLYADFAATGFIIGAWKDVSEAKDIIGGYEQGLLRKIGDCQTPLVQCLSKLSKSCEGDLDASEVSAFIDLNLSNHKLLEKPKKQDLIAAMLVLGYTFIGGMWVKQ